MASVQREPVVLFEHNSPKGVLLSIERYEELLSNLEDHYDSLKAQEYEKERKKKIKWAKLEDVLADRTQWASFSIPGRESSWKYLQSGIFDPSSQKLSCLKATTRADWM